MNPTSPNRRNYKQNDLFRSGANLRLNACVGRNGGPYTFYAYSRGYFHAGERLIQSVVHTQVSIDLLIYPIVFCFRHGIELAIKDLVIILPKLWNQTNAIQLTHDLINDWTLARGFLSQEPFQSNDATTDQVEKVLTDLVALDPNGQAFRFPSARDGKLFLQDTAIINLDVFADAMSLVAGAFDYWQTLGREALQTRYEMEELGI